MAEMKQPGSDDAFKEIMAAARAEPGRAELAHQSLGRPLSEAEQVLADALMDIYAQGETDQATVAAALTQRGVVAPNSGFRSWTAENLETELQTLNNDLDESYRENSFGAASPNGS
ncbi:recombinase-like helix-turn-helix domain-containing protein [Hoeflea prorocentri]|uniref:Recombinase-like domain-containing protein n=1 Tax=Hoeflea prorocentri TaxID=1922333 RepID=A0A9X3ZG31_9HYPH|nr:recombinase-like helix-turn-helix domain-containing protein [Hoeflea prorocentri]MCY6379769.1 hypothetical protein [Hoeflea prorocentri]MDA5397569.1 hypothetical protein [Hoeflea prorocentri]